MPTFLPHPVSSMVMSAADVSVILVVWLPQTFVVCTSQLAKVFPCHKKSIAGQGADFGERKEHAHPLDTMGEHKFMCNHVQILKVWG